MAPNKGKQKSQASKSMTPYRPQQNKQNQRCPVLSSRFQNSQIFPQQVQQPLNRKERRQIKYWVFF